MISRIVRFSFPKTANIFDLFFFACGANIFCNLSCKRMGCIHRKSDIIFPYKRSHLWLIHPPGYDPDSLILSQNAFSIFGCGADTTLHFHLWCIPGEQSAFCCSRENPYLVFFHLTFTLSTHFLTSDFSCLYQKVLLSSAFSCAF